MNKRIVSIDIITLDNGHNIEVTRINNDVNGNPRYIVHFRDMALTLEEYQQGKRYGMSKYNAKWFGGGLVFQSYNIKSTLQSAYNKVIQAKKEEK